MKTNHRIIAIALVAALYSAPASADTFKPFKYLQDASVISALASAVSQLEGCEGKILFSETKKKSNDGAIMDVGVTCNKFPDDNGKLGRSAVHVELELNRDGSIGSPVGFSYD